MKLSILQGGDSSEVGASFVLTPCREKGGNRGGGACALFYGINLALESCHLLWLLLGELRAGGGCGAM